MRTFARQWQAPAHAPYLDKHIDCDSEYRFLSVRSRFLATNE